MKMNISEIKIINYKSFIETPVLRFSDGFNVIVGQNNVGKTALLEALSTTFQNKPHLSAKTKPTPSSAVNNSSRIEFSIALSGESLHEILQERLGGYRFPYKKGTPLNANLLASYIEEFESNEIIEIPAI